MDPYPEPSRTRVCGQDILCWRKRASFDVSLDDSGLQTYLEEEFTYLPTQSPFRIWSEIFPPTLVDHIVEQTNLYAHRDCNFPAFSTDREDISSFLGVLLLSGYHHLPEEDHHWSNCEDLGVPIVSKAMSRASFRNINRHIHFADNHNLEQGNKIAKVAPVYTSRLTPPLPNLECSTKICRLMNRWCHTLGAKVRRCSFVESPSASGTRSGAFAVRTAIRTTCKSTKARRQHPATSPSARGSSTTWLKLFGRILMVQTPLLLRTTSSHSTSS